MERNLFKAEDENIEGHKGWTSLTKMILFFNGLILIPIVIAAGYIAKVFEKTKGRHRHLVFEKIIFDD